MDSLGSPENFSRFDHLYDGPEEKYHHEACPMSYKEDSTLCLCVRLDKADRMAREEERRDDERKYGE